MPEHDNNTTDTYGFSDIERIQQEIARDLGQAWPEADAEETPSLDTVAYPFAMDIEIPPAAETVSDISVSSSFEERPHESDDVNQTIETPPVTHNVFYRETIKQNTRPRKVRSWRKTVAVLVVICTLGTGTLGLGIGAAIPLTRHYLSGGINETQSGDNASALGGIISTRSVFSPVSDVTPRGGSMADVIRLVEPSVVSVSSLFEGYDDSANATAQTGDASGIIFSEDSQKVYIATNYHVVNGASAVNISIMGSGPLPAKMVGREPDADLAVISVDKADMRNAGITSIVIAVFGDSDQMEVGDMVLAIGNAMGEGNSATQGIISATEKTIPGEKRELTVLQTDAAINFGNSGGPLVNTRGEVIGINTAKLSDYYYAVEGMGYSISSNVAKPILEDLLTKPRPFLGIYGQTVTDKIAETLDIPAIGAYVSDVIKDTGAEKAGIIRTDIITSFNGNSVFTMEQLIEEVKKCEVGDTVEVKILRDGTTSMTLYITLGTNNPDNF